MRACIRYVEKNRKRARHREGKKTVGNFYFWSNIRRWLCPLLINLSEIFLFLPFLQFGVKGVLCVYVYATVCSVWVVVVRVYIKQSCVFRPYSRQSPIIIDLSLATNYVTDAIFPLIFDVTLLCSVFSTLCIHFSHVECEKKEWVFVVVAVAAFRLRCV